MQQYSLMGLVILLLFISCEDNPNEQLFYKSLVTNQSRSLEQIESATETIFLTTQELLLDDAKAKFRPLNSINKGIRSRVNDLEEKIYQVKSEILYTKTSENSTPKLLELQKEVVDRLDSILHYKYNFLQEYQTVFNLRPEAIRQREKHFQTKLDVLRNELEVFDFNTFSSSEIKLWLTKTLLDVKQFEYDVIFDTNSMFCVRGFYFFDPIVLLPFKSEYAPPGVFEALISGPFDYYPNSQKLTSVSVNGVDLPVTDSLHAYYTVDYAKLNALFIQCTYWNNFTKKESYASMHYSQEYLSQIK